MKIIPGTDGPDLILGTNKADEIILGLGSDEAHARKGNDIVYGDKVIITAPTGNNMEIITFDSDITLNGGDGNDTIYGDTVTVNFIAVGGTNTGVTLSNKTVNFGSEEMTLTVLNGGIFGENGKDVLYGDLSDLNIIATGGDALAGDSNACGVVTDNVVNFGDDDIWGDAGSDVIYGDLDSLNITATGGNASGDSSTAFADVSSNDFIFGDDDLWGGAASDVIYGDLDSLNIMATGGDASGKRSTANTSVTSNFTFGDDDLWGGAASDVIYGDLDSLNIMATGGDASGDNSEASVGLISNVFTFGDDDLWGGAANDVIYGDLVSLNITSTDGTGDAPAKVTFNDFIFGDDNLNGGDGRDTLYGDVVDFNIAADITAIDNSGGMTKLTDADGNEFTFGNDIFTTGAGRDTISFTLLDDILNNLIMQGNDIVTDFSFKNDTLEFMNVTNQVGNPKVDIFDLEAVTTLSLVNLDGDGFIDDLLIQFDAGGMDAGSIGLIDFDNDPNAPDLSVSPTILDIASIIDIA